MSDLAVMVEMHARLVKQIAGRYWRRARGRAEFDDLYQAGMLGLIHAARRFDPARGLAFSTYATHCIKGLIIKELKAGVDLIRIPYKVDGEERARLRELLRPMRLMRDRRARGHDGAGDVIDGGRRRELEQEAAREEVERLRLRLGSRERAVIEAHLAGKGDREIGAAMGVTRSRAQQLRQRAMAKMKGETPRQR